MEDWIDSRPSIRKLELVCSGTDLLFNFEEAKAFVIKLLDGTI